jgi:hypothetical protein
MTLRGADLRQVRERALRGSMRLVCRPRWL